MKQVEVQIMGQSYLLGCPPEGEESLLEAVERVDAAMCKIRDGGKVKARDRIAVLAALNLAVDMPASKNVPVSAVPKAGPLSARTPDQEDQPMRALLDRLDAALGEDGRLI